jgi:hypothetical protein
VLTTRDTTDTPWGTKFEAEWTNSQIQTECECTT